MFEQFRDELDEHYDRKERITKASRDVTAASKKMCAALPLLRAQCYGFIPMLNGLTCPS